MVGTGLDVVSPVVDYHEQAGCGMEGKVAGHSLKIGKPSWVSGGEDGSSTPFTEVMIDGVIVDRFAQRLKMREGVHELLSSWPKNMGKFLLSGDHDLDRSRLKSYFKDDCMYFSQSPESKRNWIEKWRKDGRSVAMVGDGINDGLAMKSADVGIAIPVGSGRFAPSSDVIIGEDQVANVIDFFTFSRLTVKIVVFCVCVSLLYNILGLSFAMSGRLSPLMSAILMPLSSLSVMFISMVGTRWVANRTFK
jgi:Cu+-exporting ATPase